MEALEQYSCQNKGCAKYRKRGAGNIRAHGWSSRKQKIRTLYCRVCGGFFSERRGTPLWHSRLPQRKALEILQHLRKGRGVRETARLAKVSPNTVTRLKRRAPRRPGRPKGSKNKPKGSENKPKGSKNKPKRSKNKPKKA